MQVLLKLTQDTMISLFWIGLSFITASGTVLQASDGVLMFTALGDSVTVPCAINSGTQCSSITWTKADWYNSLTEVVRAGEVISQNITLLRNCSLHINNMMISDASIYTCDNGKTNSSVDLQILQITENQIASEDKIELHCSLNIYKGLVTTCNKNGMKIMWLTEDHTAIKGERFHLENVSNCFSKLFIHRKLTDHNRKWTCQLSLNGSAKATVTYKTTVEGGIEEVFAAVGESVSLTCTNASSLAFTGKGQTSTFITDTGSTSVIRNVNSLHSGDYQCLHSGKRKRVRLHTVDITSELDTRHNNVVLTCVLTCANGICENDFNLTWSEDKMQSGLLNENGTITSTKYISMVSLSTLETECSVIREGAQVAMKKWRYNNYLYGPVWIVLPLGLLCIAAAGVFYVCKKKKHNKDSEQLHTDIGMTHVYEDVQDNGLQCKRDAVTSNDSFYDLLQAVN